ncbi:MAG: hypothetical protein L3J06_09185 [Cyclobacteriaceae bacterium]|nr:hypothetical protein [Cyclobacteriaceae bacterium]
MKGQKVVYTLAREGVKTRLNQLGELIGQLLVLFFKEGSDEYKTLKKVFEQQFEVDKSRYYHLWKNRGVLN